MVRSRSRLRQVAGLTLLLVLQSTAEQFVYQPVSLRSHLTEPSSGGSWSSWGPIISGGSGSVVFCSNADDLVSFGTNSAAPLAHRINVFARDLLTKQTRLVSISYTGSGGGNGDSTSVGVSTDSRFVVFESDATNLVANDTNRAADVFVRDLLNGTTAVVSVSTNGRSGNRSSHHAAASPDGRYVAFASAASNLAQGDTNWLTDVFLRDIQSGVTRLVSVGAKATSLNGLVGASDNPRVSSDGRYVVFVSTATNLVPGVVDTSGDLYLRDMLLGVTHWVSSMARSNVQAILKTNKTVMHSYVLADDGSVAFVASPQLSTSFSPGQPANRSGLLLLFNPANGETDVVHTNVMVPLGPTEQSWLLDTTPDGSWIAFVANTNVFGVTTTSILRWERDTGNISVATGQPSNQRIRCYCPTLNSTGNRLAFVSDSTNLVDQAADGAFHVYVRDFSTGAIFLGDADDTGTGAGVSGGCIPSLDPEGELLAYDSTAASLIPNDKRAFSDVVLRHLQDGSNEVISCRSPDVPPQTPAGHSGVNRFCLSGDGRFAVFTSTAEDIANNDTNGLSDVFVRDLLGGTMLVSANLSGTTASGYSHEPAISEDGQFVVFTSGAADIVGGDTNGKEDVFVRNMRSQSVLLVSSSAMTGLPANDASCDARISCDGRYVLFRSKATDLASLPFTGENLFLRDMSLGDTFPLTQAGVTSASMTPDGHYVAFVGRPTAATNKYLCLWDNASKNVILTNADSSWGGVEMSSDGSTLAFWSASALHIHRRSSNVSWQVSVLPEGLNPSVRLNTDGKWLTYSKIYGTTKHVFLYDVAAKREHLVSHAFNSTLHAAGGRSDRPEISPDGRFVAYTSAATNLVAGDMNGMADVFLYDRITTQNSGLSGLDNRLANDFSRGPCFSADGRTLVFETWASDPIPGEANHLGDVLARTLFALTLIREDASAATLWLTWPAQAEESAVLQYGDNLASPHWRVAPGAQTNALGRSWQQVTNSAPQRYYRVLKD